MEGVMAMLAICFVSSGILFYAAMSRGSESANWILIAIALLMFTVFQFSAEIIDGINKYAN